MDPTLSSPLHRAFLAAEAPIARPAKETKEIKSERVLAEPTSESLIGLVDSWHRLNDEQLTAAAELLLALCPSACTVSSKGSKQPLQLHISLEVLDGRAFRKLQEFMTSAFFEFSSKDSNDNDNEANDEEDGKAVDNPSGDKDQEVELDQEGGESIEREPGEVIDLSGDLGSSDRKRKRSRSSSQQRNDRNS